MSLRVVVVTHNSADVIGGCLDSVVAETRDLDADIRVVDNASSDRTAEAVREGGWPVTLDLTGTNAGYAAAINRGVADASPDDDLLVLNPDVRLTPGSLRTLLDAAGRDDGAVPRAGIVVPRLVDEGGREHYSRRRESSVRRALGEALLGARSHRLGPGWSEVVGLPSLEGPRVVDWATGACVLVRAEARRELGSWDESFFLYSEETEYCLRARDAGWATVFVPEATAVHVGGESNTSPRLYALMTRNRARLYARRNGRRARASFLAALLLGEVIRAASGRATSREALLVLLGRRPALRGDAAAPGAPDAAYPTPLVCFAGQDWWYHSRAHSDVQLMVHAAQGRTVLHVNSIGLRMPTRTNTSQPVRRVLRKLASISRLVRRPLPDTPRFHVLSPVVLPFYSVPVLRRLNAWVIRLQVLAVARAIGIRRPAVVITLPTARDVVAGMDTAAVVYNRSDKHSEFPEGDKPMLQALEGALLREADAVLYVSHAFLDEERNVVGDRAYFLDHGVDLDHFRARGHEPVPADIADLEGQVIGFFGAFDDYTVDTDLLVAVAKRFPEVTLLLIGPSNLDMSTLTSQPNVRWLGPRPYADIPRYGTRFDVALMPWLRNDWIASCNPIKCKEYLALGLPVVTTEYPEAHTHADVLLIADDHEDFLDAVERVLAGQRPSPEECRAAVADAAWSSRAAQLTSLVDQIARR